jgi:hypothetical protein
VQKNTTWQLFSKEGNIDRQKILTDISMCHVILNDMARMMLCKMERNDDVRSLVFFGMQKLNNVSPQQEEMPCF